MIKFILFVSESNKTLWFIDDDNANYNFKNKPDNAVNLRLLCGADLLESFGTPGLWSDEDVRYKLYHSSAKFLKCS